MKSIKIGFILLLCVFNMAYTANSQIIAHKKSTEIDFDFLLKKMLDRDDLARYPAGKWILHHLSSYDRSSIAKDKPGWFGNHDWDNFIRIENVNGTDEHVLMDADGPGVITRFWGAGFPNKKAHLKFYIDGQTTPFWEADHTGALIGQNKAIGSPLSQRSVDMDELPINKGAQPGHNLYAPITFKHHIKITYDRTPWDNNDGFWYNIDYLLYTPGTPVKSFSEATPLNSLTLKNTNRVFNDFMDRSAKETRVAGEKAIKSASFDLLPGASKVVKLQGTGAIRRFFLSLESDSLDNAVKNLWIQIKFDGKKTIEIPAGFFFGCGDQVVEARTWYHKVDTDGTMANYWVMPYSKSAEINLLNKGDRNIAGSIKIATGSFKWDNNTMYFHAQYKKMYNYMTEAQKGTDFNYIDIKNRAGVYVGDIVEVSKSVGGWWGEGDEKIYIDGSTFPDDFGTGSEDYYGYAWGHPEIFNHIFNSQPIGNANLNDKGGLTVNSRERDLDAIPFKRSLKFDMESWNWFGGSVNYSWACFWYEKAK